jgi:hypothetical protein
MILSPALINMKTNWKPIVAKTTNCLSRKTQSTVITLTESQLRERYSNMPHDMSTQVNSFTSRQLRNFAKFERVRASGQWNSMWYIGAQEATGLRWSDYSFVMNNYESLKNRSQSQAQFGTFESFRQAWEAFFPKLVSFNIRDW